MYYSQPQMAGFPSQAAYAPQPSYPSSQAVGYRPMPAPQTVMQSGVSVAPFGSSQAQLVAQRQQAAAVDGPEEIFLFVNPKSGGNVGEVFMEAPNPFETVLHDGRKVTLHIFSMLDGESGKKPGFLKLKEVVMRHGGTPVRIVVGGGDGTVMWADSEATQVGIDTARQIVYGIVPLGTGNDFARVAGWGGNNPTEVDKNGFAKLGHMVQRWMDAKPRPHDVWKVHLVVDQEAGRILKVDKQKVEAELDKKEISATMINYFSIGQDGQVGIHFDKHRTTSQVLNLFVYGFAGLGQELRCWGIQDIRKIITNIYSEQGGKRELIMDSEGDPGEPQLIGDPECIMFLNIPSFAGGKADLWQTEFFGVEPRPPELADQTQDPGDGRLEIVTLPNIANIPLDKFVHLAKRVHSGGPYLLQFYDTASDVFCEVDGEFYHLVNPVDSKVTHEKTIMVLQNVDLESFDSESDDGGGHVFGCA